MWWAVDENNEKGMRVNQSASVCKASSSVSEHLKSHHLTCMTFPKKNDSFYPWLFSHRNRVEEKKRGLEVLKCIKTSFLHAANRG